MKEKILILSGNYGDGHQQAANAIQQALRLTRPDVESIIFDFMEWTHPYFNPISRYVFIQGVKKFPQVYGYLYRKTRSNNSLSGTLKKLNRLGISRMLKLIEVVKPTVVVSTFPLSAGAMSVLKAYGLTNVPAVTVITDHTDHSYWVHPYTDHYIVGSNIVKKGLNQYKIPSKKITVTGIPIRPEFGSSFDKQALKAKHNLKTDLPTVMMMGGGSGLIGDGAGSLTALEKIPQKLQLIIICGHNDKLKQQIEEKQKDSHHTIIVKGYVDYVHEMMAVSDLMITKPGGLTTSEAIALELPMLLYKPLPGQEQDNAKYLLQAGVASMAHSMDEVVMKLTDLLKSREKLQLMRHNAKLFHHKKAAFDAVNVIMKISQGERNKQLKELSLNY